MEYILSSKRDLYEYISAGRLMERWGLDLIEMEQLCAGQIQTYRHKKTLPHQRKWGNTAPGTKQASEKRTFEPYTVSNDSQILASAFKLEEIKRFELEHPEVINKTSHGNTALELRQLKKKLEKQNKNELEALEAAVLIGTWIQSSKVKITKPELKKFLEKKKLQKFTGRTTMEKFWKAIPSRYRNNGGARTQPLKKE